MFKGVTFSVAGIPNVKTSKTESRKDVLC